MQSVEKVIPKLVVAMIITSLALQPVCFSAYITFFNLAYGQQQETEFLSRDLSGSTIDNGH